MEEDYKLVISSQYAQAWRDPETLYCEYGREEHNQAISLMSQISNIASPREGLSVDRVKNRSTRNPTIDHHAGPGSKPNTRMDGGVPITTYIEVLTIAGTAYSAFITLLKAVSPIIIQHMKNKHAPSIVIQKGNKKIEVRNKEDLESAIKALKKIK